MKQVVLTYGLIAGAIVAGLMFITMPMVMNGMIEMENGEVVGYTTMVVALSMVFFGVKSYRDNHKSGVISFWEGCKIGLLITLIASVIYALAWEVCYSFMSEEFTQQMADGYYARLEASGASPAEILEAKKDWESFAELYKNPVIRFGVTLTEILPVGIILTLISAGILRRKEFFPAS